MTDILIIGAGPAGMTAALYAKRAGMTVTLLESSMYGGQITVTPEVENYPAVRQISGWELAENLYEQVCNLGVELQYDTIKSMQIDGRNKVAVGEQGTYTAKAMIIANGVRRRKLGCPGEEELSGMGVSYCATCDGAFFKGKEVAVIGGGSTALEDALFLSNLCSRVHLVHRRDAFRGEKHLADAVVARANIDIHYGYVPKQIEGEQHVTGLVLEKADGSGEAQRLSVSAVFVAIGLSPDNGAFAEHIALDPSGYILAGEDCATSAEGIFAAGDTRTKQVRQIVTAAADGAVAAIAASNYVNSLL